MDGWVQRQGRQANYKVARKYQRSPGHPCERAYRGRPVQPEWKNYSKLTGKKGEYYHCHLNTGRPTYVVVWQVLDRQVRVMEVRYAGTHEGVNYNSFK